ncbi:MAG: hypothetical protein ACK5QC_12735 [Bacteroidota bacterium]|jgi:hypothetical protein
MKSKSSLILFGLFFMVPIYGFTQNSLIGRWQYGRHSNFECFSAGDTVKPNTKLFIHFKDSVNFESDFGTFSSFKKYRLTGSELVLFSNEKEETYEVEIFRGRLSLKIGTSPRNYDIYYFNNNDEYYHVLEH